MTNVARGLVQGIGITDIRHMPKHPVYFNQLTVSEVIVIPEQKPDIEQLISIMVEAEVISARKIKTPMSTSHEGQILLGAKLVIEIRLKQKITYIADEPDQSVHVAEFETIISSIFIEVPPFGGSAPIGVLLNKNKISITPYIEDIYGIQRDERTVFKSITLLVDAVVRA